MACSSEFIYILTSCGRISQIQENIETTFEDKFPSGSELEINYDASLLTVSGPAKTVVFNLANFKPSIQINRSEAKLERVLLKKQIWDHF